MTLRIVLSLIALTFAAAPALADTSSANRFLPGCKDFLARDDMDVVRALESGRCAGAIEALVAVGTMTKTVCPPAGFNTGQAIRVVIAVVEAHPETMNQNFNGLGWVALIKTWPCKK